MGIQAKHHTMERLHPDLIVLKMGGEDYAKVMYLEENCFMVVIYNVYAAYFQTVERAIQFAQQKHGVLKGLAQEGIFLE